MNLRSIVASILGLSEERSNRNQTEVQVDVYSDPKIADNAKKWISRGFKIDEPDIFVPWNISTAQLEKIFLGHELTQVTPAYYTIPCRSLGNMDCFLGFHFSSGASCKLKELEFFRNSYTDQQKSFDDFQRCLLANFGAPTDTAKGSAGFDNFAWVLGGVQILHYVFDRFGPEEHVSIICK